MTKLKRSPISVVTACGLVFHVSFHTVISSHAAPVFVCSFWFACPRSLDRHTVKKVWRYWSRSNMVASSPGLSCAFSHTQTKKCWKNQSSTPTPHPHPTPPKTKKTKQKKNKQKEKSILALPILSDNPLTKGSGTTPQFNQFKPQCSSLTFVRYSSHTQLCVGIVVATNTKELLGQLLFFHLL